MNTTEPRWRELLRSFVARNILTDKRIINAFSTISRHEFLPETKQPFAAEDIALPIGHNQTISQPRTVAFMLELLQPKKGQKILDVGAGSGWTTALLSRIVGPEGRVYGLEIIPELAQKADETIKKILDKKTDAPARVLVTDGGWGYPEEAPFDRILVSASVEEIPETLIEQLKNGGIMVIPRRDTIVKLTKNEAGEVSEEVYPGFAFVPFTGSYGRND